MLSRNETLDDIVDAITERFIPITSANRVTRWNDLSGVGWGSESVPQTRSTRALDCPFFHRLLSCSKWCFVRFLSLLNVEILRIFRFRGGLGDIRLLFVTSKKRRDIVDSILLYFLSHNEFACLCSLYHEGYSGRHPHICGTSRFQKICRRIWELSIAVTNYIFYLRILSLMMSECLRIN